MEDVEIIKKRRRVSLQEEDDFLDNDPEIKDLDGVLEGGEKIKIIDNSKTGDENTEDEKVVRKKELARKRSKRFREKERLEKNETVLQNQRKLARERSRKYYEKKKVSTAKTSKNDEGKKARKKELAKERSRKYREKKRNLVSNVIGNSQIVGPSLKPDDKKVLRQPKIHDSQIAGPLRMTVSHIHDDSNSTSTYNFSVIHPTIPQQEISLPFEKNLPMQAEHSDFELSNRSIPSQELPSELPASTMSCAETEEKAPVLQMELKDDANNGKPCIDFQPGDRWQIKDDDPEVTSNSKVKDKCPNGRRSLRLRSKSNHTALVNGGGGDSSSENEAPSTNTIEAIIHTEELDKCGHPRVRSLKKKRPNCELNNGKNAMEAANNMMKLCDTEKIEKIYDQRDVSDGDSIEMPELTAEISPSAKKDLNNSIEVLEERTIPEISDSSPSVDKEIESEAVNVPEVKAAEEPKDDAEIEVINLHEDGKDDSDSEIQILNDEKEVPKTKDFPPIASEGNFLLSAGYPYYNSLREKLPALKAGEYKPVKFPHTGTLLLGENEVIIESPSLLVPLLVKESDSFPKLEEEKKVNGEQPNPSATLGKVNMISKKNFFQSSVGQFLINLGTSRVQEWYHKDMKRAKLKQLKSKKSTEENLEKTVEFHEKRYEQLTQSNAAFNLRMRQCKQCGFKTESLHVMEGHLVTPHVTSRRDYKCNFCTFLTKHVDKIVFHYRTIHKKKAILESNAVLHECIFCSFAHTLKNRVTMHMNRCRKHFFQSQNLAPPFEFEFPGVTTKPVTMSDTIGHRRLLLHTKGRLPDDNSANSAYCRKKLASVLTKLSSQASSFNDGKNTLMKQLISSQSNLPHQTIQLPPGIVITRPRGPLTQMRPIAARFPQQRLPPLRPQNIRLRPPFATTITSTASQLASAGISITPVRGTINAPRTATLTGIRNVTLTPINSTGNRMLPSRPNSPQPVALFSTTGALVGQPQARLPLNVPLTGLKPGQKPGQTPYQRLTTPPSQVVKGSSGNTFVVCEICDSYIKDLEELRVHMNFVHKVKIHPKMLVSRPPLNCQKCQWRFFTDQGLERHLLGAHGLVTTNMQENANKNSDGGRCIICGAVFTYKLVSHMTQTHKVTLKPAHLSYKCTVCTATFTLYRLFENHVYNVHSGTNKRSAEDQPSAPKKQDTGPKRCKECNVVTQDMLEHLVKNHMKECRVKLCRIEKCKKCLYSSDEMLLIRLSDFGLDDDDSSGSSDDESSDESDKQNSD